MRSIFRVAWLSSVRQPGRTGLGILGVVAVGALLFDMLLLSRGLVLSFRDLLDRIGFDVRVLATDATPLTGPPLERATATAAAIAALPEVEAVLPIRVRDAELAADRTARLQFIGADPQAKPMWTLVDGRDLVDARATDAPLLVNRNLAASARLSIGSTLLLRGVCGEDRDATPPVTFLVTGIAEFPFDDRSATTAAGRLGDLRRLCGDRDEDRADMLLVRSSPRAGSDAAAERIRALLPELHTVTNDEIVLRFSHVEFSYFEQISFVLATVTLFFGFLLITVLLTVSVNQRLGEIAALRAIGLSRLRVMVGVLCESVLVVGAGGVLAIPVGGVLSLWLDGILRALPGIPLSVSFFVFEPHTLVTYAWLLAVAAMGAAIYPMRIVGALPIAATLRREVVS